MPLLVGGESCVTHNDAEFAAVRGALRVPDDFLAGFDWGALQAGGGKGGALLAFHHHKTGTYVVKELSPSDHTTLLWFAAAYSAHATTPEGSLLAPLYAHFVRPATGVLYVAMGSVLPPLPAEITAAASPCLYDLKGTADDKTLVFEGERVVDVHKRFFNVGLRCCDFLARRSCWCRRAAANAADLWAPGRREYAQGKRHAREVHFPVTPLCYGWLVARLESDVSFLREHGLMDFSLLVRTHRLPPVHKASVQARPAVAAAHEAARRVAAASAAAPVAARFALACEVADGSVCLIDVGLIDYLQEWTLAKRLARCLKFAEVPPYKHKSTEPPPYYAKRFLAALTAKYRPVGRAPGAADQRFPSWTPSSAALLEACSGRRSAVRSPLAMLRAALAAALTWLMWYGAASSEAAVERAPSAESAVADVRARSYSQLAEATRAAE